ncbi:MAG: pantoate--beta-alanine ligase, partial [Candidatus Aenigmatarchaeota archaeon]
VFGEKDYQQLLVIKRMVSDLNLDVRIIGYPTVREEDGLAMSSRNLYLNEKERKAALVLSRSLKKARELYRMGLRDPEALRNELIEEIKKEPLVRLQYLEICSSKDLKPVMEIGPDTLVAIAAFVGNARLIDNCIIGG